MDPGLATQLAGFRGARRELEASVLRLATSVEFSFVPPSLFDRAVTFDQGEALIAGKISV